MRWSIIWVIILVNCNLSAQVSIPSSASENINFDRNKPIQINDTRATKAYAEDWFSLPFELVNLGEIEPVSPSPFTIFPDSTIIWGFQFNTNPVFANKHGIADVICPSRTPAGWINNWGEVVVDSISVAYNYTRNTNTDIVDTIYADILSLNGNQFGYNDLNNNNTYDPGEFYHNIIPHTGNTDELDQGEVLRTDTILLTNQFTTSSSGIQYFRWDVNDTVDGGKQYGIYFRFRPGYNWVAGDDTLSKYNKFSFIVRKQEIGQSLQQLWPDESAFCTYVNDKSTRYGYGTFANSLFPGVVADANYIAEHMYILYKLTTQELSTKALPENFNAINIFPNPVQTNAPINITINLQKSATLNTHLLDLNGKSVLRQKMKGIEGEHTYKVLFPNIQPGYYSLVINGYSSKIVVF